MRVCVCYLPSVQSDGGERECGDVQRAVLDEAADVTHHPAEHPVTVDEAHLGTHARTRTHAHAQERKEMQMNI